ncbi:hypothetical protein RQP46_010540 [Phenoliferia psychrophenolica]
MATIDSLAPELLDEIFEHFPLGYRCLDHLRASLVCRRWREPAQRLLFQNVVLRTKRMADAWLQSTGRARYRTRSLTMGQWENQAQLLSMEVLKACPDLRSLWLGDCEDGGYEWCSSAHVEESFPYDAGPLTTRNLRHLSLYADLGINSNEAVFSPIRHSLVYLSLEALDAYSAPALIKCFADKPFPLVRHLLLNEPLGFELWPKLITSFPSLVTLEILYSHPTNLNETLVAVGASVVATLQNLIFTGIWMSGDTIAELLHLIKLPNLAGLRRLEIPAVSKDELAGATGLALLDECEERSISLRCRYGYL